MEKNNNVTYTNNTKVIHGYECREGFHIGHMNDTTTFWTTDKIGLNRTLWSLVDVDGFVLETQHQNGIKKVIKDINFQDVQDTFFTKEIEKIKTYKKETYYGLKIVEAKWELDYYKDRLEDYRKRRDDGEITAENFETIENDFKSWFKDIENRIGELKEKNNLN